MLRVARPSGNLDALLPFWRDGLGFAVLARFEDHGGIDGLILGHPAAPWHLEFTRHHGRPPPPPPDPDDLLALYLPDAEVWRAAVARMEGEGHATVEPANPYWATRGRGFRDLEGRNVILWHGAWTV